MMKMHRKVPLLMILLAQAVLADAQMDALIAGLQETYDSVRTMSAKFEQTYKSPRFESDKKESGFLEIQKPGKMRWDYAIPKGKLLVSDGDTISLYDPQDRQVMVNKQPKDQNLPAAISFLSGKGKLKDSFTFEWIQKPKDGKALLRAIPKSKEPNVKEVQFHVSMEKPMTIVGTIILDELGGESHIALSKVKMNPKISEKKFSFKAPTGVTVILPNM